MPLIKQAGEHDCGAAAAAMVLEFWGRPTSPMEIRDASAVPLDRGLQAGFLRSYLRERGLRAFLLEGTFDDLRHELDAGRPVLVGVVKPYSDRMVAHYQVVVGVNQSRERLVVLDPAEGMRVYSFAAFEREWEPSRHLMLPVCAQADVATAR